MGRETSRKLGALVGLAIAVAVMNGLGFAGVIPLFLFGVGGAVGGGMTGERLSDWRRTK